jgi:hypothetical protein
VSSPNLLRTSGQPDQSVVAGRTIGLDPDHVTGLST